MQNIKRGLQMGFIWEMELHEYKSHVDKGLEFFISVKLLIFLNNVSHCPWSTGTKRCIGQSIESHSISYVLSHLSRTVQDEETLPVTNEVRQILSLCAVDGSDTVLLGTTRTSLLIW